MKFVVGFLLAFLSIFIGSPLIALLMGSLLVIVFKFPNDYIERSVATNLLQAGIILIGLTISASTALEVTFKYFPYVSVFVLIIFFMGLLLADLFKIEKKLGILLASGTAICGATAMVAISPLIKAKSKDLLVALAIIFIFNTFAIGVLPLVGIKLSMSSESFGAWSSMAVHDTSSVIGTAIAFGGSALETATTLKLSRTIWLIPLIIILGIFYPNKSRVKFPIFISLFIAAIAVGSIFNLSQETINLIDTTGTIFLISALFCLGTQISLETIKEINTKTFIFALSLWLVALIFSFLIINLFT
tara:strand:- start:170 stop:1078 length:909 start_codon:yes stop_codon:yes gene_type:complete